MAACSIDTAVRNIITTGGNLNEIYLLDTFVGVKETMLKDYGNLRRRQKPVLNML